MCLTAAIRAKCAIDTADTLPADDVFYFSVERSDPRHALFVQESAGSRGLLYFKAALEASGQSAFEIDPATVDQVANVAPGKYAFVVLSDLGAVPPTFEQALRDYVRGGGSVLISLGHLSVGRTKVPVTGDAIQEARYTGREGERFQTAAWLDSSHPSILKDDRWEGVKFFQAIHVAPGNARVAAKLSDQTPLLIDQQIGEGHVLVFASTFDNVANDFPVHPSFVPFIEQTARYLGRLDAGPASAGGRVRRVARFQGKGRGGGCGGSQGRTRAFARRGHQGAEHPVHAGRFLRYPPAQRTQRVGGGECGPAGERSDTGPAGEPCFVAEYSPRDCRRGKLASGEEQKPVSLWWYVMLAVLLLAVAESLLGNQHLSVDKEAAV